MINKNVKTVAKNLASQNEFDILKYRKMWNENYIFHAAIKGYEGARIGYPKFIIVDNENNARFASRDETDEIMDTNNFTDEELMEAERIINQRVL
jgi:hypothetical protein